MSITGGAKPASEASRQRATHTHQRLPASNPANPYSGRGELKLFPLAIEKAKNSSVICTQTIWLSLPSIQVSQQPV